ncbi:MAG TPA: polynucleotide kinase-phosphatase, partial [Chroococcales cyanobacterium]
YADGGVQPVKITVPELCLVAMVGTSGSGKSSFARKHFKETEVISSDFCRGLVSDDENDQTATRDAFEVLHFIAGKRLRAGKLTVVDATNVQPESRKSLVELAREYHCLPVAIVLDLPERVCVERNKSRPDRDFGPHVIRNQNNQLRRSLRGLQKEGFRYVFVLRSEEEVEAAVVERQPLWNNRKHEHGPFDIVGDVHGCFDELRALFEKLGYQISESAEPDLFGYKVTPPAGRKAVFVGDLVDRGPATPAVLRLVMSMVSAGSALCVPGNHDMKLMRKLKGRDVRITHGLAESLGQLEREPESFKPQLVEFLDNLVSHYVLDDGKLVVAHAGMKEALQGRGSGRVRDFALYGETTGETDEYGLPVRYNWAAEYRGKAMVVYGHTPVAEPEWTNHTINVDTGCVFGGRLTALRYPERELISVPAARMYYEPAKPLYPQEQAPPPPPAGGGDNMLDINDVIGKRVVNTRLQRNITVREENAIAALEVMSRFAVDPRWLIYLPPTMSPCETSSEPGFLEHPEGAFNYYRQRGVAQLVLEEKHMGSRAVVVVCRDQESARKRFGVSDQGTGICYTRTGRRFFNDQALEKEFLSCIAGSLTESQLWEELKTDWVLLDCELMPWSAKAQELLRQQYAAVGRAALLSTASAHQALSQASRRGVNCTALLDSMAERQELSARFVESYRRYCWNATALSDYKLAPFHILASEGKVHVDKNHHWHMAMAALLAKGAPQLIMSTNYLNVDLTDQASYEAGVAWWKDLTSRGGEGMVVKPLEFISQGTKGYLQPAIKCRGPEYLRIIYGPEYTLPENLERLRKRGLNTKRSLAMREFSLGIEALERFARQEPLYRVHECVFGVLALESEPVDPRL